MDETQVEVARFEVGNELLHAASVLEGLARKLRTQAVVRLRDVGLSQPQIGELVGLSPQMISKLEKEGRDG